jgi:N-acyl-D-amino-acid deacylase
VRVSRRRFLRDAGASAVFLGLRGRLLAGQSGDFDVLLRGGNLLDGTGAPAIRSDLGLRGARIAAIGDLAGRSAGRTLDLDGLTLCPGFIDVHAHSEDELLVNPKAESKIRQGVTTEILGMDGDSYPPDRFSSELARLEKQGIALNVGSFVGQGTLRGLVLSMSDRAPSDEELARMRKLAASALGQGALGISSGLEYTPGGFASTSEIADLCAVMRGPGALYATHLRNEDDRVLPSIEEAIEIAERARVGLHISHLKCQGKRNWDKVDEVFEVIERAEARGVSVTMDRYPYLAYSTTLSNLMPLWSREGGSAAFIQRLESDEDWPRIRAAMEEKIALLGSWNEVMVSTVRVEKNMRFQGRTVAEIVRETGEDPFLFTRALVIEENAEAGMVGFGMGEESTDRILAHPRCMPASDGSALADYGELRRGNPHPRSYGTFARILATYVRDRKVLSLEEAIRKMTTLPADRFGLAERGRLAEGFFADVVAFDPLKVQDRATFSEPQRYAEGFAAVLVNGSIVYLDGERTEALPGRAIRGRIRATEG